MTSSPLSRRGRELIELYRQMAENGYRRSDGTFVPVAYADFELRAYRSKLRGLLRQFNVSTVLDYGSGGSDWHAPGFDDASGLSAVDYFGLSGVGKYEPARNIDQRTPCDCVICFDVLEHIHILDVRNVLLDIFRNATRLVVVNVACYAAAARLPNGENAHVTVRPPLWWKGLIDSVSTEFPDVAVCLMCSVEWRKTKSYPVWRAADWAAQDGFEVKDGFY